ncbi:hypothetical protein WJX79_009062 [Trebouxia sp. C0005]
MLREAASSLCRNTVRRDPVAIFRQLSHQYASSSAPAPQVSTESTAAVDELRQRLASGPSFFDFTSGSADTAYSVPAPTWKEKKRKPDWLKREVPGGENYTRIKSKLPHIAETIQGLKRETGGRLLVEALVPDFAGNEDSIKLVAASGLDVYAHNIETVESLQSVVRDRRANWKQSMAALKLAKQSGARVTKTSIMLGCGEQPDEVLHAFRTLRENGVDVVTLGQYMRPTKRHMAVEEYVTPEMFSAYQAEAEKMGFLYVAAGPMVRSSYKAGEFFLQNILREGQDLKVAEAR